MRRYRLFGYLFAAALAAAALAGCNQAAPREEQDPRLLNFPGLEWGMTPDEVRAIHPLENEQTQEDSPEFADHIAVYGEMEFFGVEGALVLFHFYDNNYDGKFSLHNVEVRLPASTDMDAVRDAMAEYYGTPAEDYPSRTTWESELLCQDIMSEEDIAYVKTLGEHYQDILTNPVSTIVRSTYAYRPYTFPDGEPSENSVGFSTKYTYYVYEGGLAGQLERDAAGTP